MSKTGTIGGVYGLDIPPVHKYRVGYENGAKYAVSSIKTLGVYQPPSGAKSFNDPDWGKHQATAMFVQAADVVFAAGGNTATARLGAAAPATTLCAAAHSAQ